MQVFTLLDTVQRDNEDEIDELMNNSGAEFIASEEIELISNPDDASVLTVEANVHVIDEAEIFCSLLITFCSLLITFSSLLVTFLLVARYFMLIARYFLLVACYLLPFACYNVNKIKLLEIKLL